MSNDLFPDPVLPVRAPQSAPAPEPPPPPRIRVASVPRPRSLDVPLWRVLGLGTVLTAAFLAALQPYRETDFGVLLLQRGFVQSITIFLALSVLAFVGLKAFRSMEVARHLRDRARLPRLGDEPPVPARIADVRDQLVRAGGVVALRRARVLDAFVGSSRRSGASLAAEDDAAHAEAEMEGSYALPRAMIWAIPLMGFIGTVVGISAAVAGFSGFLQQAEEIEEIKAGINIVTNGLAVAFDTTLVALALSVVTMLPLVLMERREARLLRALDADVQDSVLPRLPEEEARPAGVDAAQVRAAVAAALDEHLPSPEMMVEPARQWIEGAARAVAEATQASLATLREAAASVREGGRLSHDALAEEAARFRDLLEQRDRAFVAVLQESVAALRGEGAEAARQLRAEADASAQRLHESLTRASAALDEVSTSVRVRMEALADVSRQTSELAALQRTVTETLHALEESSRLGVVLSGVDRTLQGLAPTLDRLAQPRRIVLVEAENGVRSHAQG